MSINTQSRLVASKTRPDSTTIFYRPEAQIMIMEFPRQGAYLYHNVPVGAYEMLKQTPVVRASFLGGRRHRYSLIRA